MAWKLTIWNISTFNVSKTILNIIKWGFFWKKFGNILYEFLFYFPKITLNATLNWNIIKWVLICSLSSADLFLII